MKRIAYIELDTHAELAQNFFELTSEMHGIAVDFYFSEKIYKFLQITGDNIHLTDYTELLERLKKEKYELVIIGTVHRHFNFYNAIVRSYNTAIVVHNLNFTKASGWQLFKSIFKKDRRYRLKLFLKEGLLDAANVYKKSKYLFGIDELTAKQNDLRFLPIYFNRFKSENPDSDVITIVVPGAVSQQRRDYKSFLEKLRDFKNTGFSYEVILLGKASEDEIESLNKIIVQIPQFINIKYFKEKVVQDEFDQWMSKADVLYCPIQTESEFFSVKEIYGKTKISGNIGDAIKYGKPAIFPATYRSDLKFIIEEKTDVQSQFIDVKNGTYDFSSYSQNKISDRLKKMLEKL